MYNMVVPDNVTPKFSLYVAGAMVLKILKESGPLCFELLYDRFKMELNESNVIRVFVLSLDWLFLLGAIYINEDKEICVCL